MFERGLPAAREVLVKEHKTFVRLLQNDPQYQGILDMEAVRAGGPSWESEMVGRMTDLQCRPPQTAQTPALAFAHTALDA